MAFGFNTQLRGVPHAISFLRRASESPHFRKPYVSAFRNCRYPMYPLMLLRKK